MVKKLPDKFKGGNCYRKVVLIMKLSLAFTILFSFSAVAVVFPQPHSVTMDVGSESLSSVLVKIKDASQTQILFNEDAIAGVQSTVATLRNTPVDKALEIVLADTGFTFREVNGVYVITAREQQNPTDRSLTIRGVVRDAEGNPIAGTAVANLTNSSGTVTDGGGGYELTVKTGERIRFSFLGYVSQEFVVSRSIFTGDNILNVVLQEDNTDIETVAVIGYGTTQRIKDATGSISHIGARDIESAPMSSNVQSLLQGRAAGVNVQIQSASPTSPVSVIIRGQSSLSGDNQPLWVIDGIPEYNTGVEGNVSNVLYSLNLNDIESIDILKDASSTAIYGSRAAHGVIVVTTKSGITGRRPTIEFSSRIGVQFMDMNGSDYFDREQYINFTRAATRKEVLIAGSFDNFTRRYLDEQAWFSMNTSEFDVWRIPDLEGAYYDESNRWLKLTTQNPVHQQYDLTLRGGNQDLNYVASVFANDAQGVIKKGYSRVYGGSVKIEANISKYLKFRMNARGSTRKTSNKDSMLDIIRRVRPDLPMYNEDGSIYTHDAYTANPLTLLANTDRGDVEDFKGKIGLDYTIFDGLTLSTEGSLDYLNSETLSYNRGMEPSESYRSRTTTKADTKLWNNRIMYANMFGKHDVLAAVNFEIERHQNKYYAMYGTGFADDEVMNSFDDVNSLDRMRETYRQNSMLSFIGRVQYNYDRRYLLTLTFRRDGSSKFGPDSRWGNFPSLGTGWTFSNEEFIRESWLGRYLSHGKIRFSIGKAGSQNLADYQWMTMVASNFYNGSSGIYPENIGNNSLQWEETLMTDTALELEFWDSRIQFTGGYFTKKGDNLIYDQNLPLSTAFDVMTANMATTKTRGYELSLTVDAVRTGDWWVSFNFNASRNKTKVVKFNNSMEELSPGFYSNQIIEKGGYIGRWYGYKTAGRLFGTGEEVASLKWRDTDGTIKDYRGSYEYVGDLYYLDTNGDGKITSDDMTELGSVIPKLFGGFGVNVRHKGWYMGANFSYSYGSKRWWKNRSTEMQTGNYNQTNKTAGKSAVLRDPRDPKTVPNTTPYDLAENGGGGYLADYWLYNASYIRLNSLYVRYRFDRQFLKNVGIDNIELSVSADNLFTLTKYPGYDPQGNFATNSTSIQNIQGIDYSYYPQARTLTVGLKLTF